MTEIHLPNAEIVTSTPLRGRTRSEEHALAFLARYRSDLTRRGYEIALRQWFTWLAELGVEPLDATRTHIELFARELEMTGRKVATVGTKLNVLAGYYKYAALDGLIDENPMVHVNRPQVQRISTTLGLTRTEFADVLAAAEQTPPRDHAVICLLGLNGLRVSEVCGIDIEHLGRWHGHRTVDITRKYGKRQIIPLAPRTTWMVELTMAHRTSGALFLDHTAERRLDRRAAARIVDRVVRAAGIGKRITPHSFRHTFITMALDAGIPERDIAASTGHADTRMCVYYDRGRDNIARNATHAVAAWVEGAM